MAWRMLCRNGKIEPKDLPQAWKTWTEKTAFRVLRMRTHEWHAFTLGNRTRALSMFVDMDWENGKPGPHMCMDWENGGQVIVQVD